MDDPATEVTIDEFKRLEMRVGTVVEVSRVPRTNKLYKVVVDLGTHGKKQTATSLVDFYNAEDLLHKRVIFLANLKPTTFAGQKSEGMKSLRECSWPLLKERSLLCWVLSEMFRMGHALARSSTSS